MNNRYIRPPRELVDRWLETIDRSGWSAKLNDRQQAAEVRGLRDEIRQAHSRLATIVDEAFGMQPQMPSDELMTLLERKLFEQRVHTEELRAQLQRVQVLVRIEPTANPDQRVLSIRQLLAALSQEPADPANTGAG